MKSYTLDGNSLTIPQISAIAADFTQVKLSLASKRAIRASRKLIDDWVQHGESIYGVTTGFGEFSNVRIDTHDLAQLQENLIVSHAAGAGDPLPREIVRAMMALRINALAKGFSGIRLATVETLMKMLNGNIIPVIPSQGSVGASGDLVQLAHLVLAMIGKGKVYVNAIEKDSKVAGSAGVLQKHGIAPVKLAAKEGLALINGTQMMTAFASLAADQSMQLLKTADIAAAISVEALRGSDTAFDKRIHELRPYRGQRNSANNIRRLMNGSILRESHRTNDRRVQDAYSIRCIPQVHGASRDAVEYVYEKVSVEINSANDNPLIFAKDRIHLEGGNFHGQPIALAMDFLAIALAELANISERRIERLVNGSLSGLPRFLTARGGLNSGLMIAQYTAASLVSENKVLAHPGSVDSIPTSANQEDHNSMGSISAQKAWRVLKNVQTVLAIEMLCACQGLDFATKLYTEQAPPPHSSILLRAGEGTEAAYSVLRESIPLMDHDRIIYEDIQKALRLVCGKSIVQAVEREIGGLE